MDWVEPVVWVVLVVLVVLRCCLYCRLLCSTLARCAQALGLSGSLFFS
jgi:hypothetical protein